jgi:hypothetical protein
MKENIMQKKLRYKLFALFALCAALMAISAPPAASASSVCPGSDCPRFCLPAPVDSGCDFYICCDSNGTCWCG